MKAMPTSPLVLPKLIKGHRNNIVDALRAMPAFRLIGLEVVGLGDGVSVIALPMRPELTFDGKTVQGGIVGVLADFAAVAAVIAGARRDARGSTTSFDVHNLAPAVGSKLIGVGRTIKLGLSMGVASADIYAVADDGCEEVAPLVATALATCRIVQPSF
jgi:uncharacterized protein (TIGR00369 family)